MGSVANFHGVVLQVPVISISRPLQRPSIPEDGTSLLYETYNDYFNMAENTATPMGDKISSTSGSGRSRPLPPIPLPQHQPPAEETPTYSSEIGPFFFVLSASSPLTPSTPESTFTPVSPCIAGDIPEALSHLLPQPSTSLLGVISGTKSQEPPEHRQSDGQNHPAVVIDPVHRAPAGSVCSRPPIKPGQPRLRDSTAARQTSQAFVDPLNPPASAVAEFTPNFPSPPITIQPNLHPNPIHVQDPDPKPTYPSSYNLPAAFVRPRIRSMDVNRLTPRQPLITRGHTRGLSSPFPLPIQFIFAPSSVPGSTTTPYSYF